MTTQNISLSLLVPNDGNQIAGLQANPRTITEVEFNRLKQSMKSLPELLQYRPLIVAEMENGKYCIISGNMKYAAALDMKWKELPCKIIPQGGADVDTLRRWMLKDDVSYGSDDMQALKEWDYKELKEWEGVDYAKQFDIDHFFAEGGDPFIITVQLTEDTAELVEVIKTQLKTELKQYNCKVK